MPTVGLAIIARNAEEGLAALLAQVHEHVDQIVIVLAGESEDQTRMVADLYTEDVYEIPWEDDFAAARNFSFSKLTTDWAFWLDADDLLEGDPARIRGLAQDAEDRGIGCMHLIYEYRHDDQGHPTVVQTRERLLKRDLEWTWKDRVHEYAAATKPHTVAIADDIKVVHQNEEPNTERNLRLLLMAEMEDPENPRILGALADTYATMGEFERAIKYSQACYWAVPNEDVKWNAAVEVARISIKLENWRDATQWCYAAMDVHPEYALPYLLMAHVSWYGYRDSDRALLYIADAERRQEAPIHVQRQSADYTINRWDVEHRLYADQGDFGKALQIVEGAMAYMGKRSDAWNFYTWFYMEQINIERTVAATHQILDHLFRRGDTLACIPILKNLPLSVRDDSRILAMAQKVAAATAHVYDEEKYQSFYEGNHSSLDDVDALMNGISVETYRMEPLAKRLKERGAKRVLDVGCGAGEPAIWLAQQGFEVVGLDINDLQVKEANKRAHKALPKKHWHKCVFKQGKLEDFDAEKEGQFDAVIMMELIEHVRPDTVPLLMGYAEDLLKPGGAVFLTTPGMLVGDIPGIDEVFSRDHVKEFTREELYGLLTGYQGSRTKLPINLYRLYDTKVPVPGFATWFMEYEAYSKESWAKRSGGEWEQPVSIYVGPGLENWTPETPDEVGLGGSETWAIKTAREMRRAGHPVVVYGMTSGIYDGVVYLEHTQFNPDAPFAGEKAWLTIVSRHLPVLDAKMNSDNVFFIAHDVDYGDELTEQRLANLDRYLVLSTWQLQHTFDVYEGKEVFETLRGRLASVSNGIEPAFFETEDAPERVPHSLIWSSSPDRGLDELLTWWPDIRTMWPDATLNVYYGFDNIDAMMGSRPWLAPFKERLMKLMRQEGVTNHGRIGQRQLVIEAMKHQFWVYPSKTPQEIGAESWRETFCITALEMQAAGVIPIMSGAGALPERFYFGGITADDELLLPDVEDFLVAFDQTPPTGVDGARTEILETYGWDKVTQKLLALVGESVAV